MELGVLNEVRCMKAMHLDEHTVKVQRKGRFQAATDPQNFRA